MSEVYLSLCSGLQGRAQRKMVGAGPGSKILKLIFNIMVEFLLFIYVLYDDILVVCTIIWS